MFDAELRPAPHAYLDLSSAIVLSGGLARPVSMAICDARGEPAVSFEQGQTAHFFYEFEILDSLEVVSAGLEFRDATGRVIHGKSSFESGHVAHGVGAGNRLVQHHAIQLDVAAAEYWITLGLGTSSAADYEAYRAGRTGYSTFRSRMRELCRVVDVASFLVGLRTSGRLTFHGVADLPGNCSVSIIQQSVADEPSAAEPLATSPSARSAGQATGCPTIVHVTHWKAGSQWIRRVLEECVPDLIVPPRIGELQFLRFPIQEGRVYPTVYVTRQQFDQVRGPENTRHFVVIRDLRDTLISAYFSVRYSHQVEESTLPHMRATLATLDVEDGLLHLMRDWLPQCASIQASWLESGDHLIRYRDLLEHDIEILEPLLIDRCELPISRERLRRVVEESRFENITKTRKRGEEDLSAHERKGIAGDWRNYFTDRVKDAFKLRFGALLVATGFEQDANW